MNYKKVEIRLHNKNGYYYNIMYGLNIEAAGYGKEWTKQEAINNAKLRIDELHRTHRQD